MAKVREPQIKKLTASGAVTTNNKAGILRQVVISAEDDNQKVEVLNGATSILDFFVGTANTPYTYSVPDNISPIFTTDIDCVISGSNVSATFIFEEIQS